MRTLTVILLIASTAGAWAQNGPAPGDANCDGMLSAADLSATIGTLFGSPPSACSMPITLQFRAAVGDQTFVCGETYPGVGMNGVDLTPADFRFYVHNIRLIAADEREVPLQLEQDGFWQLEDLALLDFEDKVGPCDNGTTDTNSVVRGTVPVGTYTGVRFNVGVPFRLNHQPPELAPSPLNLTRLWWNWQAGYKFIRVDAIDNPTRIHLGSTGCEANEMMTEVTSCARPNRPEVLLRDFDPETNVIVADLAALFADSVLGENQENTMPGCQSEPFDNDCEPIFTNLGLNFANGLPDLSRQAFFRAE